MNKDITICSGDAIDNPCDKESIFLFAFRNNINKEYKPYEYSPYCFEHSIEVFRDANSQIVSIIRIGER